MELSEKIKILQDLNEDALRETVLIPLFSKMGFIDPIVHHHNNEKGKDIICKEYDTKFNKTSYLTAVVKSGDVNGSASGNSSYFALINQVKQALNEPYKDIYEIKEIDIDQVIIVISGKFLPTALESIYGTLKKERIDKAIREPIDINKLVTLVDSHFKEYWTEIKDSKESLRIQRDYLLNNFSKVSKLLLPDDKFEQKLLNQVATSEININLFPFQFTRKYIADIGYKSVDIDEIDEFYADSNIHNGYCDIKKEFFDLKNECKKILYDLDEPVEILKKVLEEKSPEKIVELMEELARHVGRDGTIYVRTNGLRHQEDFNSAVQLHKAKKELLIKLQVTELYYSIVSRIQDEVYKQLLVYFQEYTVEQKDKWLKMVLKISLQAKSITGVSFETYSAEPIEQLESYGRKSRKIRDVYIQNGDEYVIDFIPNCFGFWKEENITSQQKSRKVTEHYRIEFERLFFKELGLDIEE